jgi:hypothetical protein
MEFALSTKITPRVLYKIGRYKEENLEQFGIDNLYKSVLINPSSKCCIHWFKAVSDQRGIKLQTNTNKFLANNFNKKPIAEFIATFNRLLSAGSIELTEKRTLLASTAIEDFITGLKADENLFGVQTINDDDYSNDDNTSDFYSNQDYDRDTFDAMTDGQLGDWDDFDGDIDDVMNWAGK